MYNEGIINKRIYENMVNGIKNEYNIKNIWNMRITHDISEINSKEERRGNIIKL